MKVLYFVLVVLFGLLGALGLLRGVELLLAGALKPANFLFALIFLALAFFFLGKARAK